MRFLRESARHDDANRLAPATGAITDQHQISRLLTWIQSSRETLRVRVGTSSETYRSMVLQVSEEMARVALDEPYPIDHAINLKAGTPLDISARIEGAEARFSLVVERVISTNDGLVIQARYPRAIWHHQRRRIYRVPVPFETHLSPSVLSPFNGSPVRARLVDLSTAGAGAELMSRAPINIGDRMRCDLSLREHRIEASGALRSIARSMQRDRIGLSFEGLTVRQAQMIEREVAEYQRESLRRRTPGNRKG